jgi:Flp pilus assembly protein TadG
VPLYAGERPPSEARAELVYREPISMLGRLRAFIVRLRRDRRGAVGIMAAAALPVLIGMSSLVGEYGYVLLVKTENQRVADAAAYAGALAYSNGSSSTATADAAAAVARLNGVPTSGVKTTLLANSPTGDGSPAVQVQITTSVPLYLAQVVGAKTSVPVAASAAAELSGTASPCVLALSKTGSGISGSGGTSVTTDQCSVGSNSGITLKGSATIITTSAAYNGAISLQGSAAIKTPSGTAARLVQKVSSDPLAGTSQVKAAYAGLANAANVSAPPGPPTGLGALNFDINGDANTIKALQNQGCPPTLPINGVWNIVCSSGTHNFGAVSVGGGVTVNFDVNAAGTSTYTFSGGIITQGGSNTTFGAGIYTIGGAVKCTKSATYSVCHGGNQLTFKGPSQFVITGGVYNGGGGILTMGAGTTNTFQIGPASDGNALSTDGQSMVLADAIGSAFKVKGNIVSGGGTCLAISAADEHDINGSIDGKGAVVLGSGPYYVTGYVAFGSGGGGGNSSCNGSTVDVLATNVTLVIGGSSTPNTSDCKGQAFCIGAGFSNVTITGPSSGSLAGLAVVGPKTGSAGASFLAGASGTKVSGAIYFPSGAITMGGAAAAGGGTGDCLEIIGATVTLSGGATAASNCKALSGSSTPTIQLVQ